MHPLIVHFPIACLVLYTGLEVVTFLWPRTKTSLLTTKYFLLGVGVIGSFFALQSGELAQDGGGFTGSRLVDKHEDFAEQSHSIYIILTIISLIIYLVQHNILDRYITPQYTLAQQGLDSIRYLIEHRFTSIIIVGLAIIGFVLLGITGALGAAITHGPDVDIIVRWVYDFVM